jgi:negative regulator of sigma-B (phosphoserine phosphatase)
LLVRGGVVGYRLPLLRATTLAVRCGDVLVFATDGIRANFNGGLILDQPIEDIAAGILLEHGRANDDALVLVVLCSGLPP